MMQALVVVALALSVEGADVRHGSPVGSPVPRATGIAAAPCAAGPVQEKCDFDQTWDCSVPWYVQLGVVDYYNDLFGSACVRHDGCYRHGARTYGRTRTQCDDMFYEDMRSKCNGVSDWSSWLSLGLSPAACQASALAYYRGVQNAGDPHFKRGSASTLCYYDARNENARVYKMRSDGRFGSADHRYVWSSGWWGMTALPTGGDDGFLMLKPSSGRVHVHKPRATGAVGARVETKSWTDGWTNANGYTVGGRNYLFLLKPGSGGRAQVRRINADGTVGASVKDYPNWSEGWTISEFYEVGGATYLLLVKGQNRFIDEILPAGDASGGSGLARIYRMNASDGTVGPLVKQYDWSSGWTIAKPYRVGNQRYLFLLKSETGVVRGYRIRNDGTLEYGSGTAPHYAHDWSAGWTTAETYEIEGTTYLALIKSSNGSAKIYRFNSDGRIDANEVATYDWGDGWTKLAFYRVGGQLFAIKLKTWVGGT